MTLRNYWLLLFLCSLPNVSHGDLVCSDHYEFHRELPMAVIPGPPISQWERDTQELKRIRALPNGPEKKAAIRAYAKPIPKTWKQKSWVLVNWGLALTSYVIASQRAELSAFTLMQIADGQVIAWYLADATSQAFHKWLDSIASPVRKFWGQVVQEFRKHHEYANNLNEEDYLSNVSAFGLVMTPAFAFAALFAPILPPSLTTCTNTWLLGTMNTPEIHKQAHLGRRAAFIFRCAQAASLTVSNATHMSHHEPPFTDNFAVLNGWFNPMAARLNLWARWDRSLWRRKRRMPSTWIQDPGSIPADVVDAIKLQPELIPNELWANGEVYYYRVPEAIKELLTQAKSQWRRDFVIQRRRIFQEAAALYVPETEAAAVDFEAAWHREQAEYDWIYGGARLALFE